jgi:hypothetical protein
VFVVAGFESVPDDLFNFYTNEVERRSEKVGEDSASIMKQALKVYAALVVEGKRYDC